MKRAITTVAVFAMVGAFCIGCDKGGDAAANNDVEPKDKKIVPAANWEPETLKQPSTCPEDHDHGPGGHSHGKTESAGGDKTVKVEILDAHAGHDHGPGEHDHDHDGADHSKAETPGHDTDAKTETKDDHAGHDHGPGEHDHEH